MQLLSDHLLLPHYRFVAWSRLPPLPDSAASRFWSECLRWISAAVVGCVEQPRNGFRAGIAISFCKNVPSEEECKREQAKSLIGIA